RLNSGPQWVGGQGCYRLYFPAPPDPTSSSWTVSAGFVGNLSEAYWNGKPLGDFGKIVSGMPLMPPQRTVHSWVLASGDFRGDGDLNVLSLHVKNVAGAGGLIGGPVGLFPTAEFGRLRRHLELSREAVVMLVAAFALVWALLFAMVRLTGDGSQPWLFAAGLFAVSGLVHVSGSQWLVAGADPCREKVGWVVSLMAVIYWIMPVLTLWMIRGVTEGKGWKREAFLSAIGAMLALLAWWWDEMPVRVILCYALMLLAVGGGMFSRAWQGWRRGAIAAPAVLGGLACLVVASGAQLSLFFLPWLRFSALAWQPMDLGILAAVTSVGGTLLRRYARSRRRERELAREVMESGRRERTRVGRHLHDGVAQDLQYLMLSAKRWKSDHPGDATADELVRGLGEAIGEVRRAAEDLQPLALRGATLSEALRTMASKLSERHQIPVTVNLGKLPELTDSERDTLFRAAQEGAQNACRHAKAKAVTISVTLEEGEIELRIIDDGCGFDPHGLSSERMGLKFLRDQAEFSGGELRIDSKPGSGTKVCYRLPLSRRETDG
ncbi:MAG: sensor histidine kinase, partial [Verrucomicrobiae bacterium]|nr:sensor histidine kinase [Verrucomicrobiae bacterium]